MIASSVWVPAEVVPPEIYTTRLYRIARHLVQTSGTVVRYDRRIVSRRRNTLVDTS